MKKPNIKYIPIRYIIAIIITVLEILAIIGVVVLLCYKSPFCYLIALSVQFLCVVRIIASDDNPDYKVPWLLFVVILPVIGFMLYFMFYSRKLKPRFIRRLEYLKTCCYERSDEKISDELCADDPYAASQARMLCNIAKTHIFDNTCAEFFSLGEQMHSALLCDLEKAQKFIFMEYFIIEQGVFWDSILQILRKKAAQGVTVRVVYDDIGCMLTLPGNYAKILRGYGIDCVPFSRLRGSADSEFNNRSHRKITVIDGKVGYTGGINIADEYINEKVLYGHWKDSAVRLEGEAVWELTKLFIIDYGINVKKLPDMHKTESFPACKVNAGGYVVPFGDGPLSRRRVGKSVIKNMLAHAKNYVYITTPYLIIDNDMCQSLECAALRGVDVRIIMPHIPDKKFVFSMSRSFYHRLMSAGVKIYEYEPGFVHAKNYIADDCVAMVGTINLDYRSLVHHFENGVWMYKCGCIADIKKDMLDTLEKCIEINDEMLKTSLFHRFMYALVRIFAPLM